MKPTIAQKQLDNLLQVLENFNEEMNSCKDPELLETYYKTIKKNTKLSTRKYLAAFLLSNSQTPQFSNRKQPTKPSYTQRNEKVKKPPFINTTEHKEGTKTLFVGIGRNRKVYPQDLIELFASLLEVDKEKFGLTKIFKTYSFIEVPQELCAAAIEKVAGTEFRKITLKVNFSRDGQAAEAEETL